MARGIIAITVLCVVAMVSLDGQTESVLDRLVAAQPNGRPFAFAPPIKDWSDQAVIGVGHAADVVVGFEAAPEVERVLVPLTEQRRAEIASRRRISLAGTTSKP